VKDKVSSFGYDLNIEAARKIVDKVGAKPEILAKELKKLMTYAGKVNKITESMVEDLIGEIKVESAFLLTEALKKKK